MTSHLVEDVRTRMTLVQQKAGLIQELSSRCLDMLEESGGLAATVHGVPCEELVRQYATVLATEGATIRATLDQLVRKLRGLSGEC